MRLRALPLAALIGCTAAAPGILAESCTYPGGEQFADPPLDAKSGVVSWTEGSATTPTSGQGITRQVFLDCATNRAMLVRVNGNVGPLGTRNVRQEVSAMLYSVPEGPRFGQIREGFGAMGISVLETSYTAETCACAAFYPELRGDKLAFKVAT